MKQRRLAALLGVMLSLLALHGWQPPQAGAGFEVAEPVQRSARTGSAPAAAAIGPDTLASLSQVGPVALHAGTRDIEPEAPRDIFAVRLLPAPELPTVPRLPLRSEAAPPEPTAAAQIPEPLHASVPPLQVIGSWRDAGGSSVFLAGPQGVLQGRAGQEVLGAYQIVQITPRQLLLQHLGTHREIALAMPEAAGALLTFPR